MIKNQTKHSHLIKFGYKFIKDENIYCKEKNNIIMYVDINRFLHRENGPAIISKVQDEEEYWYHGQFFLSKKNI